VNLGNNPKMGYDNLYIDPIMFSYYILSPSLFFFLTISVIVSFIYFNFIL